jgi:hypothetical protein
MYKHFKYDSTLGTGKTIEYILLSDLETSVANKVLGTDSNGVWGAVDMPAAELPTGQPTQTLWYDYDSNLVATSSLTFYNGGAYIGASLHNGTELSKLTLQEVSVYGNTGAEAFLELKGEKVLHATTNNANLISVSIGNFDTQSIKFITNYLAENKPLAVDSSGGLINIDLPASQIQSDWEQSNNSSLDYIKNKPTITNLPAGSYGRTIWYNGASWVLSNILYFTETANQKTVQIAVNMQNAITANWYNYQYSMEIGSPQLQSLKLYTSYIETGKPLILDATNKLISGSFGSTAGSFAEGNHTHTQYATANIKEFSGDWVPNFQYSIPITDETAFRLTLDFNVIDDSFRWIGKLDIWGYKSGGIVTYQGHEWGLSNGNLPSTLMQLASGTASNFDISVVSNGGGKYKFIAQINEVGIASRTAGTPAIISF